MKYLLDTNVLSEPLRPTPSDPVLRSLSKHEGSCATAAPVWHELVFGSRRLPRSQRRSALEAYLETVVRAALPILPYDEEAATWHAAERARLERKGRPTAFVDGQIAAIAATHNLIVVSGNAKHFKPFNVKVVDWR